MSRSGKETLVGFNYVVSVCLGGELTQMNIHIGFMNINELFPTDLLIIVRAVIVKRLTAILGYLDVKIGFTAVLLIVWHSNQTLLISEDMGDNYKTY